MPQLENELDEAKANASYTEVRLSKDIRKLQEEIVMLNARYESSIVQNKNAPARKASVKKAIAKVTTPKTGNTKDGNSATILKKKAAPTKKKASKLLTEFFLSTPNKDGSFNELGKSKKFKPYGTMYKFTLSDPEGMYGEFEFWNDTSNLHKALNDPDTYLLPVCENWNPININASSIRTEVRGEAEFDNGRWVLKRKARIYFET